MLLLPAVFALAASAPATTRSEPPMKSWSVTVCGPSSDPRREAIAEAVEFWNGELRDSGANLRLGPVTACDQSSPDELLMQISENVLNVGPGGRLPRELAAIEGDIVIALSGADLVSV